MCQGAQLREEKLAGSAETSVIVFISSGLIAVFSRYPIRALSVSAGWSGLTGRGIDDVSMRFGFDAIVGSFLLPNTK
jgi:hypothetical protein